MRSRPRLVTSIPFWVLVVASLASVLGGFFLSVSKIGVMEAALTDQTATGVEVYVGQAWIIVGAALLAGGIVGLVLALAIAALSSLLPQPDVTVEAIDWTSEAETAPEPVAPVGAPVTPAPTTVAAPIAVEDADVETPSVAPAPAAAAAQRDADGDAAQR